MAVIESQAWTIFVTQWRMWLNFYRRHGRVSFILSLFFSAIWYSGFAGIAVFLAGSLAQPSALESARHGLPAGLFFAFMYWQGMPLLMASVGGLLDLKKLLVYPVAEKHLYRIEILLRTALFCEMPIVMAGMTIGLLRNPALPKWCALAPVLFSVFNITLGAGIRDLISRLFQKKRVREALILLLILLAAAPSFFASRGLPKGIRETLRNVPTAWMPWAATAEASTASGGWLPWLVLAAAVPVTWIFSRWQFHRSLKFDAEAQRSADSAVSSGWLDHILGWPRAVFPDPLGALVEKEIRFLSRASRFRIVFTMGFTFGLIIWLPMTRNQGAGWMGQNFLTVVVAYALLLLGEVFYNSFGFDRTAAQLYFLVPIRPAIVLIAKNIAVLFFVIAEVTFVTLACLLLRMPMTWAKFAEAVCVSAVMILFLLGIGNLGSTRSPRAQNPNDGWRRSGASKFAFLAMLFYPVILFPIGMAYLARYAFDTQAAFFAAISAGIVIAGCFYYAALDSACEALDRDREKFLTLLAQTDTPAL